MTRLEFTCETCGSQIADPPRIASDRPVRVCCKASLAKAKTKGFGNRDPGNPDL